MDSKILYSLGLVPALALAGESGGILESNYSIAAGFSDERNASSAGISGAMNVPVYKSIGANIMAGGTHTEAENNYVDNNEYYVGGSLFVRDYKYGKLGLTTVYNKVDFGNTPLNVKEYFRYTLSGEYYLDDITLYAARTRLDGKGSNNASANTWSLGVSWYWQDNTSLGIYGGGMDNRDSYGISISTQPAFLNNSLGFSFSYGKARQNDSFCLSAEYYFDTLVSLIERDRKYR